MADSPNIPPPSTPVMAAPRRRRVWPVVVGVVVLGIVGGLTWWALAGTKFWTDGAALHVNANEARIREVVWTPPIPLTIFNTTDEVYEPSVSPDGDELYFVRGKAGQTPEPGRNADIYVSYRRMGAWTPAVPVEAVNSDYDDLGPRVSADSKFLLFYSNRPGGLGGYDIWAAPRLPSDGTKPGGWGKPFNLGPGVNSEFDEYNPDPSPDGQRLFFASNRKAAAQEQKQAWRATIRAATNADFDLWYAVRDQAPVVDTLSPSDAPTTTPTTNPGTLPSFGALVETQPSETADRGAKRKAEGVPLVFKNPLEVPGVNTTYAEGASCMSPAGDFLYFASNRPGGYGKFDIYRSRVGPDGTFGPVENLGPAINTSDNETDPQLALNGFRLYFSSDRVARAAAAPATSSPRVGATPSTGSTGSTGSAQAGSPLAGSVQAPVASNGGYGLLQSDSREVYSVRAGHRLPHLSLSWLIMALSLLALIPLVMFMRKWDDQRLSLLQKCLLVSLLVHVLITLGLSMKKVTTDVIQYVRQEQSTAPPVDLTLMLNGPANKADDVGAAVRQQSSSDLPTKSAPPAAVVEQIPGAEALAAPMLPANVQQALPRAALAPGEVPIQVAAPKVAAPKLNAAEAPQVAVPVAPQAPGLDLKVAAVPHLTQAEAPRPIAPAAAPVARVDLGQVGIEPRIETVVMPPSVQPAVPTAETVARSMASGAAAPATPTPAEVAAGVASATKVVQPDAGPVARDGNLTAPRTIVGKLSGTEASPAARALPEVARQTVAETAGAASARPVEIAGAGSKVPTAETAGGSLAGVAPHAEPTLAEVAAGAADTSKVVRANPGTVPGVGDLAAPKAPVGKVARIELKSVTEAVPGLAKQGAPDKLVDSPAAMAANLAGAASKVPAARTEAESLADTAAPQSLSERSALASNTPESVRADVPANTDLSVHPASPLPGSAAGPLASNRPDSPQAGEILAGVSRAGDAAGPGGPVTLPRLAMPASPVAAASGSGQSLASVPAPDESGAAGRPANSPSVQPTASANLAAGPTVATAPAAGGPKAISSGRPDAPTAVEVASASSRRGSPQATTQPSLADANLAGITGAKVPAVTGAAQSLADASDAGSVLAGAVGAPAQNAAPVAAAGVQAPVGNVEVASRTAGALPRIADAPPTAAEASPAPVGPAARQGADVPATTLADAGPAGLNLAAQPAGTEKSTPGVAQAVAPTTRPLDVSTAVALANDSALLGRGAGDSAAVPQVDLPRTGAAPVADVVEASVSARAADVNAAPKKLDAGSMAGASGAAAAVDPAAALPSVAAVTAGKTGSPGQSLASAAAVSPRQVVAGPIGRPAGATMAATAVVAVEGPKMQLPKVATAAVAPSAAAGPAGAPGAADAGSIAVRRAQSTPAGDDGRPIPGVMLASAGVPGISALPLSAGNDPASKSLDSTAARTLPRTVSGPSVAAPEVTVAVPKLAAPESLFQRSPEQRKPLVEKRGGTPESEGAVDRALAYLSRQQEPDGRWAVFNDDGRPGRREHRPHDMACTGLATLAFLTADHTPAREGPYRETVTRSVDYLVGMEGPDGDMRGPRRFRGGGADQGNMYDQGICTMALCEAALMTGDRRYTDAALRAAQFIVNAQNAKGGWRYSPAEAGDTSVLGWQMLALHDAEQLGFQIPEQTKPRAQRYLESVSQGRTKILAGYLPGERHTSAMTAEALFARLLLGDEITGPQTKEVCEYLTRQLPNPGSSDLYFWYYASLSLSQMPDLVKDGPQAGGPDEAIAADAWKKWNARTRDTLIKMQKKEGPADGSWSDARWGDRGGRVFSTSLATLTLEVYYRYLPLRAPVDEEYHDAAPENDPRRASAEIKASRPAAVTTRTPPAKPRRRAWNDNGGHYPGIEPN